MHKITISSPFTITIIVFLAPGLIEIGNGTIFRDYQLSIIHPATQLLETTFSILFFSELDIDIA